MIRFSTSDPYAPVFSRADLVRVFWAASRSEITQCLHLLQEADARYWERRARDLEDAWTTRPDDAAIHPSASPESIDTHRDRALADVRNYRFHAHLLRQMGPEPRLFDDMYAVLSDALVMTQPLDLEGRDAA